MTLEGKIKRFDALKEVNPGVEAIRAAAGTLGTLFTLDAETEFEATAALVEMKLTDRKSGTVVWQGDAEATLGGKDFIDPGGWSVYEKAARALKQAVNKLILQLQEVEIDPASVSLGVPPDDGHRQEELIERTPTD